MGKMQEQAVRVERRKLLNYSIAMRPMEDNHVIIRVSQCGPGLAQLQAWFIKESGKILFPSARRPFAPDIVHFMARLGQRVANFHGGADHAGVSIGRKIHHLENFHLVLRDENFPMTAALKSVCKCHAKAAPAPRPRQCHRLGRVSRKSWRALYRK